MVYKILLERPADCLLSGRLSQKVFSIPFINIDKNNKNTAENLLKDVSMGVFHGSLGCSGRRFFFLDSNE